MLYDFLCVTAGSERNVLCKIEFKVVSVMKNDKVKIQSWSQLPEAFEIKLEYSHDLFRASLICYFKLVKGNIFMLWRLVYMQLPSPVISIPEFIIFHIQRQSSRSAGNREK